MKIVVPAIITATVGLSLAAQTTGSLQGKVVDSKGKPIANCKVTVSKIGINWVKELKTNADGKFFQVGFAPGDYDITASAQGFVDEKVTDHISVGAVLQKDFTLMTPSEAAASGKGGTQPDPSAISEAKGLESFNQAVGFYNEKNYAAALPLFEAAAKDLSESLEKATDPTVKAETEAKLAKVQRPFAFSMMEVAKTDEARKIELATKAEPILVKMLEKSPKDPNTLIYLMDVANAKQDAEGAKKYQAALDALQGPNPKIAYNQGVELYNAGKLAEAKPHLQKAISIDGSYADAYYLLAMCEFAEMNLKGTKANLQKYLELAPTGKHATEVKDMLKAPELKNVK